MPGWCDPDPALIELAAFLLFPHFGNTNKRDPEAIQAIIDLFEPIRRNRTMQTMFDARFDASGPIEDISVQMRLRREGVRGSAYPDQTRAEIENIQCTLEEWFQARIGIGIRRALVVAEAVFEQMTRNAEETKTKVLNAIGGKPMSVSNSKSC